MLAAGFAGALFAVHGSNPEAVVWIAGRFDLLATFFLLAGLLLFTVADARMVLHAAALGCFALAALSKEAAFIFPLLVGGYALWKRQPLRWTAAHFMWIVPYFALAAVLFAYNWSLVLLAIAYMAAMIRIGLHQRTTRPLWPAAAAILICVIPVLSLMAGSPALAGSRVLYLPSVWFAILIALALDGVPARARYVAAVIVLLFQFAALQYNLEFWEQASARVKAACATGAPVLPDSVNGVPLLANGKRDCIEITRDTPSRP
jgi:hypothetical protein